MRARSLSLLTVLCILTSTRGQEPAIAALAYHPGGAFLAAGRNRDLLLLDPVSGELKQTLAGLDGRVTALACDRAGTRLAVALGEPGAAGKVLLATCGKDGVTKQ